MPAQKFFSRTFSSLKIRNYRLYFFSQAISLSGTFLQALAQDWLVLKLTNSGTMLGLVSAFQFAPMLVLTFWGGVIADRISKKKLLFVTQTISAVLALILGVLVMTGTVKLWMVFILALSFGITNSIDNPSRQSFVYDMVGPHEIKNAVSIWGILISITRIIGPAVAGVLIATVGLGLCFIINGLSYIPVLIAFLYIRSDELHPSDRSEPGKGQIREGLRYVRHTRILYETLMIMAIVGTITYEWQASVPLYARFALGGDAGVYSALTVAMSVGMLLGGVLNAQRSHASEERMIYSALFLGVFTVVTAYMPNLIFAIIGFAVVGLFSIFVANLSNTILQLNAESKMRGRVMSLWSIAFMGSTAIGGPIIGFIGEYVGPRYGLVAGGAGALLAGFYGLYLRARIQNPD